jgi:hypothetical protein
MRETAEKKGQNDEKTSLIVLLIQFADISREEIVGEIRARTDTTSVASGYVLAFLGENQHILDRVVQEQLDMFGDDILRPVRSDDLPRMVYLEQVGNCLLRSFVFSRIVAIFRHDIKRRSYINTYITHTHTHTHTHIYIRIICFP